MTREDVIERFRYLIRCEEYNGGRDKKYWVDTLNYAISSIQQLQQANLRIEELYHHEAENFTLKKQLKEAIARCAELESKIYGKNGYKNMEEKLIEALTAITSEGGENGKHILIFSAKQMQGIAREVLTQYEARKNKNE